MNDKTYRAGEFPQRIEIELVSACNLQCTFCPRRFINKAGGFISPVLFKKLIDEIAEYPETILVLHRRGESLLHPDFIDFCSYIKGKFRQIQLATNATLLNERISEAIIDTMSFISFSIDLPEVFERSRIPAQYKDVESKILQFLALNSGRVHTQVSMVKTAHTPCEDPEKFKQLWRGKVNRIRIYEEHSRDGRFGSLARDRGKRMPCAMPFYEILVYDDGEVGRCNHDWNGASMGNLNFTTIKDLWKSTAYLELRKEHQSLEIRDQVCRDCDSWYPQQGEQLTGETIKCEESSCH